MDSSYYSPGERGLYAATEAAYALCQAGEHEAASVILTAAADAYREVEA